MESAQATFPELSTARVIAEAKEAVGSAAKVLSEEAWSTLASYLRRRAVDVWEEMPATVVVTAADVGINGSTRDETRARLDRSQLIAQLQAQWMRCVVEIVQRLTNDRQLIVRELVEGEDPGLVHEVQLGLGDPHNEGRSVACIRFSGGTRVVYKPRSVRLLCAWNRLLRSVGQVAQIDVGRLPAVVDLDTHGWMSWVDERQATDAEQQDLLSRRAGLVLAVAFVLGSSDLHSENVRLSGDTPVLLDAETLLWIDWKRRRGVDSIREPAFNDLMRDSVVRTGMVPRWQSVGAQIRDVSPLTSAVKESIEEVDSTQLETGFRMAYEALASESGRAAVEQFLDEVEGAPVRAVLRPSAFYERMCRELMQSGMDPEALPLQWVDRWSKLSFVEQAALKRLDIPLLALPDDADKRAVPAHDAAWTGRRYVERRISGLCPSDLERQVQCIRASVALLRHGRGQSADPWESSSLDPLALPDTPRLLDAAQRIGHLILRNAVRVDGGFLWLTCRPVNSARRWRIEPADFGLYDGSVGTGVFLSALYACTGDPYWRRAATGALKPVMDALFYGGDCMPFVNRFGVGGAEGIGGVLYGLALATQLTGKQPYVHACLGAIRNLHFGAVGNDPEVLYGAAGVVAGAVAAYDLAGESWVIDWANRNGRRFAIPSLFASNLSVQIRSERGFAHGTSGTAAVLGGLWLRSGDELCGASAVRFRALREPVDIDAAFETDPTRALSWCHGVAGFLASEWGCEAACAAMDVRGHQESVTRLLTRLSTPRAQTSESTLCCGLAGHVDLLVHAIRRRIRVPAEVHDRLSEATSTLIERFERGRLGGRLAEPDVWPYSAGLYGGLSGIGYALLRVAMPDRVPSPLLWTSLEN